MRLELPILSVFILASCATAQETDVAAPAETETAQAAAPAQPVPCDSPAYHAFDFWVGEWEVFGPDGTKAGDNRISRQEGGCLLLEEWTSAGGNTGQSYNFYEPVADEWRQVWVSRGAVIDYVGNLTETGSMRLEGDIKYRNQTSFPFMGEWTLQDDGSVVQHFEQYNPETDTWDEWFTGTYRRAGSDETE